MDNLKHMRGELLKYCIGLGGNITIQNWIKNLSKREALNIGEVEHIIDYLIYKNFDSLSWASYDLLKAKSDKWTRMLNQNVLAIDEEYGKDIEVILDFENGYRWVKLLSQNSYTREGNMMSHCVSSYYGRDVEIFSLRDSFNKPHCTIEKDRQIKGKGNGDISPKYIDYVVKFLEYTGMKVRDSEMSNLGYRVAKFRDFVKNNLYRDKYIRKNEVEIYEDNVIIFNELKDIKPEKIGNKIVCFDGDLSFSKEYEGVIKLINHIGGDAWLKGANLDLPQLESIGGNAYFEGATLDLPQLRSIGGNAYFRGATLDLLQLQSICGYVDFEGATLDLPQLKSIGGSAWLKKSANLKLPQLESIGGDAWLTGANLDLPQLKTIRGNVWLKGANFNKPKNINIGGEIYL